MRKHSKLPLKSCGKDRGKGKGFYNTIHLQGDQLKKATQQAKSQETKVYDLLRSMPLAKLTKHEIKLQLVANGLIKDITPESSINRALSNLLDEGKVIKLDEMRQGQFDKPNHLWMVRAEAGKEISNIGTQTTFIYD